MCVQTSLKDVPGTESGTPMLNWDSRYLCHFSTEMAETWSPGTSFSMFEHAKFQPSISCTFKVMKVFCGVFSDFH